MNDHRSDLATGGARQGVPIRDPIANERLGHAVLEPSGDFEAGSFATFTLTYTAGRHGIDDSGALRIVFRFASDQSRPQMENPTGPGYTTVEASNGAVLECRYDPKGHVRPWDRALTIRVVHGFLKEGDRIAIRFGDRSKGSPGMRVQTFCEDRFEFRVLVDPIATVNFQALPVQPAIRIVPAQPVRWVAVVPTLRRVGDPFRLSIKAEDRWGNPSDQVDAQLALRATATVEGLPASVHIKRGQRALVIDDLRCSGPGDVRIEVLDHAGGTLTAANPLRVVDRADLVPYWADLHAQSEETIGTNSAEAFFRFGRDLAFVDLIGHQGNDFQITTPFWVALNALSAEANDDGRYVTLPGYEWSGNTGLGGDRNVYFASEGRPIRRSSHALVDDRSDLALDCTTAAQLFETLRAAGEDAVCFAHCGGRYADVKLAHDDVLERSVEVHSSWGTFEWLLRDALEMNYRVGIVANSDGHKGRPGAEWPGASLFGAYGGLTCLLMPALTRKAAFDCLRSRHHYATTGARVHLSVTASFSAGGDLHDEEPKLAKGRTRRVDMAMMGDIVHVPEGDATLLVSVAGSAPIERIDLFNGVEHVETVRPYRASELGNRIRVVWEGAAYRGRFRQVVWDGHARLSNNRFVDARPINFFNPDKPLQRPREDMLAWTALTTGNFGGFDGWVEDPFAGTLEIETPLVKCGIPLEDVGLEDERFEVGGLDRRLRVFRMPAENSHRAMELSRPIALRAAGDNPIYVRVTFEDGHLAWSSPLYLFR